MGKSRHRNPFPRSTKIPELDLSFIREPKPKPFSTRMKKYGRIVGAMLFGFFVGVFCYGIIQSIWG